MSMFVWFGMFLLGILFIALALRDERRDEDAERSQNAVRQIRDVNTLPLNHVREALRSRPAASQPRKEPTPHHRTPRYQRNARLVK
jgi:hypothetical protein